jgi:hypothetical protein
MITFLAPRKDEKAVKYNMEGEVVKSFIFVN